MSAQTPPESTFTTSAGTDVPPGEGPPGLDQDVQEAKDALRAAAKALQKPADAVAALFGVFGDPTGGDTEVWTAAFGDQADTVEMLLRGEISNKGLAQVTLRMIAKDVQGIAARLLESAGVKESEAAMNALELKPGVPDDEDTAEHEVEVNVSNEESAKSKVEAALPEDRYWSAPAGALSETERDEDAEADEAEATEEETDVEFLHRAASALDDSEAWRLHEIAERLAAMEADAVPLRVQDMIKKLTGAGDALVEVVGDLLTFAPGLGSLEREGG